MNSEFRSLGPVKLTLTLLVVLMAITAAAQNAGFAAPLTPTFSQAKAFDVSQPLRAIASARPNRTMQGLPQEPIEIRPEGGPVAKNQGFSGDSALQSNRGTPQQALAAYRRFHQVEIQLKSAAAEEKTHVLEARLKLEKMESELALAHAREAELASLNQQLSLADREKSILLRKLERQSYEDALTGLHNRRSLDARLSADFLRARRYHNPLSVALADLDFFKQINDRLSHAVGDEVLRVIAHVMRESIRGTDYAARYGGEEFALVFSETKLADAVAVCEKIRHRIATYEWSKLHQDLDVTISFGVTEALPTSKGHEDLIAVADRLLYRAKRAGKNQVVSALDHLPDHH